MSSAAFVLWFAEFLLIWLVGVRAVHRHNLLYAISLWLVFTDLICFMLAAHAGWGAYIWAYWIQKGGKYFLLCLLCAFLIGKILDAHQRLIYACAGILTAGTVLLTALVLRGDLASRLLDGGMAATVLMIAALALTWNERRRTLERTWNWVAVGLIVLLAGDLLVLGASKVWWPAHHLKWAAEFIQLGLWNYGLRAKQAEFRVPLERRFEEIQKATTTE